MTGQMTTRRAFLGTLATSASGCAGLRMPKSPSRMPERLANPRQISGEGIKLIKHFEGCRLKAYPCPGGKWTIGYGHTAGVKEGDSISEAQAEQLLRKDLLRHEQVVLEHFKDTNLRQNQLDALVSGDFNASIIGCGQGFSKFAAQEISRLNTLSVQQYLGQASVLVKYMCQYHYANNKPLDGLLRRRLSEGLLFLGLPNPILSEEEYEIAKRHSIKTTQELQNSPNGTLKQLIPSLYETILKDRI